MPFDVAKWSLDISATDRTANAFATVERRMQSLERVQAQAASRMDAAFRIASRALAPLAAGFTLAAIAQRTFEAGMKAGGLIDQATQLGITTDQLQAYRLAAAQSGVAAEQLDGALQRLTGQMGAANNGSDEAIARFDRLGVKLLDVEGKLRKPADVLPELARGLLKVSSETERNALAQEIFGRSGSRIVTMLETLAQGNDAVTEAARKQGAIVSGETSEAWNKLDARLKAAQQQADATLASLGKPIATYGLEWFNKNLEVTIKQIQFLKNLIPGLGDPLTALDSEIAAQQKLLDHPARQGANNSVIEQRIAGLKAQRDALLSGPTFQLPDASVMANIPGGGARNPVGDAARKTGESLAAKQLKEGQQIIDDLVASFERLRKASEGVLDRYGDGAAYAARETAELNEMLETGLIDATVHARAIEDVTRKADDMARAYRGAAGGVDGFIAGIEQGMEDMRRANSEFERGKRAVQMLEDAFEDFFDVLVGNSQNSFEQVALNFALMFAKMEMRAAASSLWQAAGGGGGIAGGILNFLGIGSGGGASNTLGGMHTDAVGNVGYFADGGRPPVGMPSIVGEEGPEVFWPDSAGTVIPNHALGGGDSITIIQHMTFGSDVNQATLKSWGEKVKQATVSEVIDQRRRGGPMKRAFAS